jgi:hypothetical protein
MPGAYMQPIACGPEPDPAFRGCDFRKVGKNKGRTSSNRIHDFRAYSAIKAGVLQGGSRDHQTVRSLQDVCVAMANDGIADLFGLLVTD